MPKPTKGPRFGGSPAHEKLIMANLATALFEHGRITTTEAKARRLRPLAEKLITKARRGDLAARRQVMTVVRDKSVVHTLFTEIGPQFAERPGGYTRITKLGPRKGDSAPMAQIELVSEPLGATTSRATATADRAEAKAEEAVDTAAEAEATAEEAKAEQSTAKADAAEAKAEEAVDQAAEAEATAEKAKDGE